MYFESCFPIHSFTRKQKNNKWITLGIKTTFKRKQGVYVLSKISICPIMKSHYQHCCRILSRVIRRAKLLCCSNMISSSKNKSRSLWRIIRDEKGKSGTNNQTSTSFKSDNLIINPIQIANAFNDYCINVADNISDQSMSVIDHALKLLQNSFPQGFPEMINIPITEIAIVCTVNSVNNKNSSGFDEISNKLLKS